MSIIISRGGRSAIRLTPQPVRYEEFLQRFVQDNPSMLPLDEYREGISLAVLPRVFLTVSGPIDALATDQEGEMYLIGTKLYRNSDKRYDFPQVLDY
jgi:hypothetical protein